MISPLLAKLYGIILENKINEWLEMEGKRDKGQANFRGENMKLGNTFACFLTKQIAKLYVFQLQPFKSISPLGISP